MQNFSVLMSVYHKERPEFLCASLDSVFNQTAKPSEVILVEDGPLTQELNHKIKEYRDKYPNLIIIPLAENKGLGNALNEGFKYCTNELVARMDTDDICKPFRFEQQLKVFENHPEIDVCSSWVDEFINDINQIENQRYLPEYHKDISAFAKSRCPINHPAVMYRKSKVLSVGGYQGFPEDSYLWVKMLMAGCQFYNIQNSLLWFRVSKDLYKRRGGWKYAKQDFKSQLSFYKCGFLSFPIFIKNVIIRCSIRLMPNSIRSFIYKKLLRK